MWGASPFTCPWYNWFMSDFSSSTKAKQKLMFNWQWSLWVLWFSNHCQMSLSVLSTYYFIITINTDASLTFNPDLRPNDSHYIDTLQSRVEHHQQTLIISQQSTDTEHPSLAIKTNATLIGKLALKYAIKVHKEPFTIYWVIGSLGSWNRRQTSNLRSRRSWWFTSIHSKPEEGICLSWNWQFWGGPKNRITFSL